MNKQFNMNDKTYKVWRNHKGYACITVKVGSKERAYLLHKLVWERANGSVPDGHDLHHIDHDKANWSLDNLMPVDRQTHQELHRRVRSTVVNNKPGREKEKKTMIPTTNKEREEQGAAMW
jgi:hypothetical protein